ncbi:MAG TPA: hypothetical protein VIU11_24165 [Nakamurella sp.]
MTTTLLDRPPAPAAPTYDVLFLLAERDRADLWRAVDRVAGAAFCNNLDPTVVTFTRRRIADHFGVADDLVDVMVTTQLVSLTGRLSRELGASGH